MPDWAIYLYGCDLDADPPQHRDLGIRPIHLPARDLEGIARLARTALLCRAGLGAQSPNAGHVEDKSGRVVLRLFCAGLNEIHMEAVEEERT